MQRTNHTVQVFNSDELKTNNAICSSCNNCSACEVQMNVTNWHFRQMLERLLNKRCIKLPYDENSKCYRGKCGCNNNALAGIAMVEAVATASLLVQSASATTDVMTTITSVGGGGGEEAASSSMTTPPTIMFQKLFWECIHDCGI
jgi:hypothetical protein